MLDNTTPNHALAALVIPLLKGVIYKVNEDNEYGRAIAELGWNRETIQQITGGGIV